MAQTRQEIRVAWDKENLKRYTISFHKEHAADIIAFVEKKKSEGYRTSEIFGDAIAAAMDQDKDFQRRIEAGESVTKGGYIYELRMVDRYDDSTETLVTEKRIQRCRIDGDTWEDISL